MASGMEQFQEKARQAWIWTRAQGLRVAGVAWTRAVALYRRGLAHLMTLPPVRRALVLGLWSFLAVLALVTLYMLLLIPLTPSIHDLRQARAAAPSTMVSADGKELARFDQGLQERVTLQQISPNVISALISTEDHRFYQHHGIDFTRTAGAILHTAGGNPQGGSTITQQLARNMFPEEI
ncbi:MAG: transglycosylase domain-containing protein, partial [Janthinobacterium sp.]